MKSTWYIPTFINLVRQVPSVKKLLPLEIGAAEDRVVAFAPAQHALAAAYIYEPDQAQLLDEIVPRFTALAGLPVDHGVFSQRTRGAHGGDEKRKPTVRHLWRVYCN